MPTALLFTAMVSLVNAAAMTLLALRDRSPYLRDWAVSFFLVVSGVIALIGITLFLFLPKPDKSRFATMASSKGQTELT